MTRYASGADGRIGRCTAGLRSCLGNIANDSSLPFVQPGDPRAFDCGSADRGRRANSSRRKSNVDKPKQLTPQEVERAVAELRRQMEGLAGQPAQRVDCTEETIEQGLAKLVLGLIELLRQLLERQAIRRMEGGTLSDQQVEEMGLALMKLEEKLKELVEQFGLKPEDLNLALGPLGNLLE